MRMRRMQDPTINRFKKRVTADSTFHGSNPLLQRLLWGWVATSNVSQRPPPLGWIENAFGSFVVLLCDSML